MSGLKETKTKGSEDEMEVDIVDSETEQEENMAVTLPSVDGCSAVDSSEMNQTDVRSRSDLKTVQVRTSNNGQATSVLGTEVNEGRDPQISNGPAIDSELDQSDRKENDNLLKTDKISGSYVVSDCLSTGLDPVDSNTPLECNVGTKQRIEDCDMMPDCGSDDNDEDEPYNRFFFESDYLALKDNAHYHMLLQNLVALEGQRITAIKDLDILCEEEAKALDDPIAFVEKLQNNEPVFLPERQKVVKLPSIPWEEYATALGPVEKAALSSYHHTRAATQSLEKAAVSAVQSCSASSASAENSIFSMARLATDEQSLSPFGTGRDSSKTITYNQPWTKEEQCRLEKLLQVYPQEEVEAKRWEKIANALGNRTMKQVASRVQKYFIKLTKAGLPVPGRVPNISKIGSRTRRAGHHYTTIGFRTSTFFPSYQPRVYMDDDQDDLSSLCNSEDAFLSDDEMVPSELQDTPEYRELMELKSVKRQKLRHLTQSQNAAFAHQGYMCDGCGSNPIMGVRYHCSVCLDDASIDFCSGCMESSKSRSHDPTHRLEPILGTPSGFLDNDYVDMSGYNYLDTNFLPAAS